MLSRPPYRRTVLVFTTFCVWTVLAAPPVDAGLRDMIANVRDTMSCGTKAVFKPLRDFEWGMKNFERLNAEEYDRRTDQSMKEVMKECMEASENILSRGFGVEKIAGKARSLIASAKGAADRVTKWFGKGSPTPNDPRMALSVDDGERNFYEKETGILGRNPLPATPDTVNPVTARIDSESVWDAAPDPWSDTDGNVWEETLSAEEDPWGQDEVGSEEAWYESEQTDDELAADEPGEDEEADYVATLRELERQEAEARRLAEEERLRAEREAEEARRLAEAEERREMARLQAEWERKQERQKMANARAWQNLFSGLSSGLNAFANVQRQQREAQSPYTSSRNMARCSAEDKRELRRWQSEARKTIAAQREGGFNSAADRGEQTLRESETLCSSLP